MTKFLLPRDFLCQISSSTELCYGANSGAAEEYCINWASGVDQDPFEGSWTYYIIGNKGESVVRIMFELESDALIFKLSVP